MAWRFEPVDNSCLDCGHTVQPTMERNYILYDGPRRLYKRQCAACHDVERKRRLTSKIATCGKKGAA